VSPFIRFNKPRKLHRQAVIVERMAKGFDGKTLFKDFSFQVEAGERVAIIGPNGIGKTTLLRTLVNELTPDAGTVKWTDAAELGYYAQDHAHDFEDGLQPVSTGWANGPRAASKIVRGTLGRMLFSNDEILKSVKVISAVSSMRPRVPRTIWLAPWVHWPIQSNRLQSSSKSCAFPERVVTQLCGIRSYFTVPGIRGQFVDQGAQQVVCNRYRSGR